MNDKKISIGDPTSSIEVELSTKVVKHNEEFLQQLQEERAMTDDLKEAMRDDNFQAIIEKKRKENLLQEQGPIPDGSLLEDNMKSATMKKFVSLKLGVVGSGQAGGKLAEIFYKYGYETCVFNTARQDLDLLDVDDKLKFLVGDGVIGGTGKDLDISAELFEEHEDEVKEHLSSCLKDVDTFVLALSGAGGTGAGSAEFLVNALAEEGKPLIVLYVLPGSFDSVQGKSNAVNTLQTLSDLCSNNVISSLILVDNAAIEDSYPNLSQAAFFKTANEAVVKPLHIFNSLSATPSNHESLDSMDFAKALIENNGYCVFGSNTISEEWYSQDETALMEAIIDGLDDGLLARGFDLKEAQNVGVVVTARESVLESIPYMNIAYIFKYISDEFKSANAFKGVYGVPSDSNDIEVHFIFSGLGPPKGRIDSLQAESEAHQKALKEKRDGLEMRIKGGKDSASSSIDRKIAKIKKKKSGTGRLLNPSKPPRRR